MVTSDDWTKSAMSDGEVVAELLVSLKEAKVTPLLFTNPTVEALRWGIRQPRSRSPRKEAESRCSPSTPLSWSGGCGASSSSPSGYVDGYEATSRRRICTVGSRSKVPVTSDLDFDVKRLHKRKDMGSLRSSIIENKNLKRMKFQIDHNQNMAVEDENRKADGKFLLPDLNIMPCDENCDHYSSLGVETTLHGIRMIR